MGRSRRSGWRATLRNLAPMLVLSVLLAPPTAPAQEGEEHEAQRRALLIGINEYITEEFVDLRGAVNDVMSLREILITRFGFSPSEITVLTDQAATRSAILAALEQLAEESRPRDTLYVHFSGHGSQVRDFNGDEIDDDLDETILPHDARTEKIADITDDELGEIFGRIRSNTAVVVLDSCHSGTATRGGVVTRSVPPDSRIELYRNPRSEVAQRAIVSLDRPQEYVLLTGAASHQSALDGPVAGEFRGFFSYALSESLGMASREVSPRELHRGIEENLARLSEKFGGLRLPEPQIEASTELMDRPLFGSAGAIGSSRPYLAVVRESEGRVRLLRGRALGASVGSYWIVYPPGETEFRQGEGLARATVVRVDGPDAIAEIDPSDLDLGVGHRAVALGPAPPATRVSVRWEQTKPQLSARLQAEIRKRLPDVEFVGKSEFARFVVEVRDGVCRVFDASGLGLVEEFPAGDDDEAADRLAALLTRSLNASTLLALSNPQSPLRVDLRIVGLDEEAGLRIRRAGESRSRQNSLMLEIRSNADGYITIVDVDTEGGVNVLFPNSYTREGFHPNGFIRAGETVRIPDTLQGGNRAGFFWDCQPPAGLDTIQVFATPDPAIADLIRSWIGRIPGVVTRGAGASSPPRADGHKALRELRTELARTVTLRGIGVVPDESGMVDGETDPGGASGGSGTEEDAIEDEPQQENAAAGGAVSDWTSAAVQIRIHE